MTKPSFDHDIYCKSLHVPIVVFDSDARIVTSNVAATTLLEDFFDYRAGQPQADFFDYLQSIHSEEIVQKARALFRSKYASVCPVISIPSKKMGERQLKFLLMSYIDDLRFVIIDDVTRYRNMLVDADCNLKFRFQG